ncbi:DNRLRE domain-containing protein [Paenibacillus sp. J5C_2022]|uniref:CBM96 family carbohydrate-binding protein n=1 Tax=Paenibacillus sp. J5C2022 TaxID=2977129 RepID=UPI0021CE6226|nr:DNRLRE domain-containing protein [Paenibacillus sp. J5C2022]MCU6711254.1 DNRLRE domain-containing protein [Paenibacillus sp. J5C2022]
MKDARRRMVNGGVMGLVMAAVVSSLLLLYGVPFSGFVKAVADNSGASEPLPLLNNGSFEAVDGSLPQGWNISTYTGTPTVAADSQQAYDSQYSVKLSASSKGRASVHQIASVKGDTTYELTAWVKLDQLASSDRGATIRLQFYDQAYNSVGSSLFAGNWTGTQDWRKITYSFRTPADTTRLHVENFLWNAVGTVWFDNMTLTELKPWESANMLLNPSLDSVVNGFPEAWSKQTNSGAPVFEAELLQPYAGEAALRISAEAPTRAKISQTVSIQANKDYYLSFWVKTEQLVSPDLGSTVRLQMFNSNWGKLGDNIMIGSWKGDKEWTKVSFSFRSPDTAALLMIEPYLWHATGSVSFDHFHLEESGWLVSMFKNGHPRLLADDARFAEIASHIATDPVAARWYQDVKAQADAMLSEPVATYSIPDGLRLLDTSRLVLKRIYTLAMMYHLDQNPAYAERAWMELNAAASFPDWNPRHFLDTAEMTHAFAIGYDWLYDYWTTDRKDTIRDAIATKGLMPGLSQYETATWPSKLHNWNIVCNGGLLAGALAIGDEPAYGHLADNIIRQSLESIPKAISQFAPNGGWFEGYGYWEYAAHYLALYLGGLEAVIGTSFGLSDSPGVSETASFPIYMEGPTGRAFNFSDSGSGTLAAPQMLWFAQKFDNPLYQWAREGSIGTPQALLWYTPNSYTGPAANGLEKDRLYSHAQVGLMRSAWESPHAVFAGFKGAVADSSHKHLDAGEFIVDALGVRWASALGPDNYNLPGYFDRSNQRWSYYRLRSEGTNTLVIGPDGGREQNYEVAAPITDFQSSPSEVYAIADLTPVYADKAVSTKRGLKLFHDRRYILLQDEVVTSQAEDIWWFMHTVTGIESISGDGKEATLEQDGKRLWLRILSSQGEFQYMDAEPLPQTADPAGQNTNAGVKKLVIHEPNTQQLQLSVLMVPLQPWESPPSSQQLPAVTSLSSWSLPGGASSLLSSIAMDGQGLPDFVSDTFTYDVKLPASQAEIPLITAASVDAQANVIVTPPASLPGTAWIEVSDHASALTTRYAIHMDLEEEPPLPSLPVAAVSASSHDGNVPANTIDGDLSTRWSSLGSGEWIQYDLGSLQTIETISIAWFRGTERRGYFDAAVSQDGVEWTTVIANGVSSGKSLKPEHYATATRTARYVKIIGKGNSVNAYNSLTEVQFYSQPLPPTVIDNVFDSAVFANAPSNLIVGEALALELAGSMTDGTAADLSQAQVHYYSSNPAIASISEQGVVYPHAQGDVRITALIIHNRKMEVARLEVTAMMRGTIFAASDTYVRGGDHAHKNYGQQSELNVKLANGDNTKRISYMKFDVSEIASPSVTESVYLNLYGFIRDGDGSESDIYIYPVTDDNWDEHAMTWHSQLNYGAALGSSHFTSVADWHRIDVTDFVLAEAAGDGVATFAIAQAGVGYATVIHSKEHAESRPFLLYTPLPQGSSTAPPAAGVLSDDNGHDTGLMDGDYTISMNIWHGNQAQRYKLYENGQLIDTQTLEDRAPNAQRAVTAIAGRNNGTYTYRAELVNIHGVTYTETHTVIVTDANPAHAVLSHNNWQQGDEYEITMNLWWGTNAHTYRLYENGMLIDEQRLSAHSPSAQSTLTNIAGRLPGGYTYYAELINDTGLTATDEITVKVIES